MTTQRWTDEMLDKLTETVDKNAVAIEKLTQNTDKQREEFDERLNNLNKTVDKNAIAIEKLTQDIDKQREESKELNIRFNAYQQASQWVVNLAFGLLVTATITTIVSAVFRK